VTVDMHCHYLPPALDEAFRARRDPPWIETLADGAERLHLPIGFLPFLREDYVDMDRRIAFMDAHGIARQMVSLPGLFGLDSLPASECGALLTAYNDHAAALAAAHPDRFAAIAALPLADIDAAVAEYRRARTGRGLSGMILPVSGFISVEAATRYAPLLSAAQQLGGHVFIHPGRRPDQVPPPGGQPKAYPYADNVLARQALAVQDAVGNCMVTLIHGGVLAPFPDVTVQVANLGGTLTIVTERIAHAVALRDPDAAPPAIPDRLYVDCASLGPVALEAAVAVYGADRVVFGTDCPVFETPRTLRAVADARLDDSQRRAILSDNAAALLDRASPSG
jgi:predicted TIM-barrel fold metal-dependent hydrolase